MGRRLMVTSLVVTLALIAGGMAAASAESALPGPSPAPSEPPNGHETPLPACGTETPKPGINLCRITDPKKIAEMNKQMRDTPPTGTYQTSPPQNEEESEFDPVPGVPFTASATGFVEFGSFTIDALPIDGVPEPPDRWVDRMLALSPSGIFIACGIAIGNINVTVETSLGRPSVPAGWEHIVEASVKTSDRGELYLNGVDDVPRISGNLASGGAGEYRIRVSARGRAIAYDDVSEKVTEFYLVQVWPEPASAPALVLTPTGPQQ